MLNRDFLVKWFIENNKELAYEMMKSSHTLNEIDSPNPYHIEGSVWAHTLMVMTFVETQYKYNIINRDEYRILILTALLHDIGKPASREIIPETNRVRFTGHEGISTFMAIDILNNLRNYLFKNAKNAYDFLTEDGILIILKIISLHGTNSDETEENYSLRKLFRTADKMGAIRAENTESDYTPRKFTNSGSKDANKELVILVGLPACGKTSFIKANFKDYTIISRDDEMIKYCNSKNVKFDNYSDYFTFCNGESFNKYFEKVIQDATKQNKVVIDMTNLTLSSRRQKLNIFKKFKAKAVVFLTGLNTISERNLKRSLKENKLIKDSTYYNMMKGFVIPVKEEGFDTIEYVM